jgi:hypothetical protein
VALVLPHNPIVNLLVGDLLSHSVAVKRLPLLVKEDRALLVQIIVDATSVIASTTIQHYNVRSLQGPISLHVHLLLMLPVVLVLEQQEDAMLLLARLHA